jgi:serine/threonine protein kinase
MPLSRGQKLLHFTLVDKIGEGGMGEVWKAVDTTLDREVAIKVLPEAFSSDRERMARLDDVQLQTHSLNRRTVVALGLWKLEREPALREPQTALCEESAKSTSFRERAPRCL